MLENSARVIAYAVPVVAVAVLAYVGAVEVSGPYLVLTTVGTLDLRLVDHRLLILTGLCERLPRYVWSDRGLSPEPPPAQGRTP